jgi:hypothetical protein
MCDEKRFKGKEVLGLTRDELCLVKILLPVKHRQAFSLDELKVS